MSASEAEKLWVEAHRKIKAGQLAAAVRDLAKAYGLLKELRDPRLGQVHRRWVEVHKLYQARKARAVEASVPPEVVRAESRYQAQEAERKAREGEPMSLEQRAETAANLGKLDEAIELYKRITTAQPQNELAAERLRELVAAKARAASMSVPPKASVTQTPIIAEPKPVPERLAPTQGVPTQVPVNAALVVDPSWPRAPGSTAESKVAFLNGYLAQIKKRRHAV